MNNGLGSTRPPIAVVGVSALFPGSVDKTGFWSDILAGTDLMSDVPPSHWLIDDYYDDDMFAPDKTYGRRGGFLDPVDLDVMGFGIPPTTVPATDTAQLLALIVAQRVLDDATRGSFSETERARTSVILGVTSGQELLGAMASRMNRPMWLQGMRRAGVPEAEAQAACQQIADLHPEWIESTFPGLLGNVVAGRIANRLDLGGTNCVTDAACASSFSSISMGVNELYLGDSDMVIAGGVDTMNDIFMYMCFSKTPALSKTEDIRPFSDKADGTMLGEGLSMVALKRLDDAERDGNRIYCVINGVGSSSDGRSKSVYAPVSAGQARALDNAYTKAGYGPETVELVEAHGTGTVAGDAAEFGGLQLAFDSSGREDRQWCALGSVKSQVGHTKAAAGAAGLFKVVMALHHKVLPGTAKIDKPNPELDLANSPFTLNTRSRPWVRGSGHERRGSVSSFGFGGSNFHVALSEYTGSGLRAERLRTSDTELVVTTADTAALLIDKARDQAGLATEPGVLVWLAQTSQRSYDSAAPCRLAVVASDEADYVAKIDKALALIEADPAKSFSTPTGTHYGLGPAAGDVAFMFPGQGSQYLFMGADLAAHYAEAMEPWDLAADLDWPAEPLQDVVFPTTSFEEDAEATQLSLLTATQWAQPAIGAMSLSLTRLLRQLGVTPAHVAGHSFGEVSALHAAGVLSERDMIEVARRRGELMAEAAQTPGSMTAVAKPIEEVRALVESSGIDVVVANHNSPTQVVLSGVTSAIEQIEAKLSEAGMTAKRLPVATAFHSAVVSGASGAFADYLETVDFSPPTTAVYGNETAAPYGSNAADIRAQLGRQLANPVRFVEMVEAMYSAGARTFIEVGPATTLTGLLAKILGDRQHHAVALDKRKKGGQSAFLGGLAALVATGIPMTFDPLWADYGEIENPHDADRPKLVIPINGANHAKPYPPQDLTELVGPNPERSTAPAAQVPSPAAAPSASPEAEARPPAAATQSSDTIAAAPDPVASSPASPSPVSPSPVLSSQGVATAMTPDVLVAYQAVQHQTAEAHATYLTVMAQAHASFLDAAQQGIGVLGQLAAGTPALPVAPGPLAPATAVAPSAPAPVTAVAPSAPAPVTTVPEAPVVPPTPAQPAAVIATAPAALAPEPVAESAPSQGAGVGSGSVDLMGLLLVTVAEKTGYPADMLSMEMELEADLGIDSIKRVEILSAMQDAVPALPEVDTAVMAELVTLGQIVDYMQGVMGDAGGSSAVVVAPESAPSESVGGASGSVDLMGLLLVTVAEKTGYPADMLSMEMELEADLGIDSIKRVEILSAMQDAVPALPEVDTAVMAELVTLGQIVDYMQGVMGDDGPASNSPASNSPASNGHASNGQVTNGETADASARAAMPPSEPAPVTLGRFVLETVPSTASGQRMPGLDDGPIAVVDGQSGVGAPLVAALSDAGVRAVLAEDVNDQLHTGVVFLGGLRNFAGIDDAVAANREAFVAARSLATRTTAGGVFVTASDLGGSFGSHGIDPTQAWAGGLAGLTRTAAIEWPATAVKAIDLERAGASPAELAVAIAHELLEGGTDIDVGLQANGGRVTLQNSPVEVAGGSLPLGADDVVVVSGGARGVTAATMVELARSSGARFVLLGRTTLEDEAAEHASATDDAMLKRVLLDQATSAGQKVAPAELGRRASAILANREIRASVDAIEQAGGHAQYVAVDITNEVAVAEALTSVRAQWGPITAVVHGAGVLADKLIAEKTDEQFDRVFDTKVGGLRVLLAATSEDDLKMICLFSSVAARTGNTGQADYAMANEVLNKVAVAEHQRRGNGCVVKSLGWGPWEGGMVSPALKTHFESMGVSLISLAAGAAMLVDEIASPQAGQVEVLLGGGVLSNRPVQQASA